MSENKFFLSICIPSYNRPEGIKRALESVDADKYADEIQIVVCEDYAPKRLEVRKVVQDFQATSKYAVKYVENEVNLGHGKNWRHCAHEAEGEYLMYIGDDDMVAPNALDKFIEWLHAHSNLGYVCRAYQTLKADGSVTDNRYYNKDRFYDPGIDGYVAFFMKSNLMTGYTIKREHTYDFEDPSVDYTLYYQMYLMGEVCLRYPSGYCNIPVGQYVGDGVSFFGTNEVEKGHFQVGKKVAEDLSYINNFWAVTSLIDKKNGINSTPRLKDEFSKFSSYPLLLREKIRGGNVALKKCRDELVKMGCGNSRYFKLYYWALRWFGPNFCQFAIKTIRKIHGGRPDL